MVDNIILVGAVLEYESAHKNIILDLANKFYNKGYNISIINIGNTTVNDTYPIYNINEDMDIIHMLINQRPVVISFCDIHLLYQFIKYKTYINFYWIHYFLSETDHIGNMYTTPKNEQINIKDLLDIIDIVIPASNMSEQCLKTLQVKHTDIIPIQLPYLFDIRNYDPIYKFIVVGNNTYRKNLANIIISLNNFKDLKMCIITNKEYSPYGWDLRWLINKYNLANRIDIYTNITNETLTELYNQSEILINSSYAEGYGLPILEMLSLNKQVIIPKKTFINLNLNTLPNIHILQNGRTNYYPHGIPQEWDYYSIDNITAGMFMSIHKKPIDIRDSIVNQFYNDNTDKFIQHIQESNIWQ